MQATTSIAVVTSAQLPELFGGEKLLLPELRAQGFQVDVVVWDDPEVRWSTFDVVLIRCPWDYHEKLQHFHAWLAHLAQLDLRVINPLETLRWNLNKNYLFELIAAGAAVIPSICLQPSDTRSLAELLQTMESPEIVVKPVQSAGAWRTLRVNSQNLAEANAEFATWRLEQDYLVQPFMPEIVTDGEWSMMFFNGRYSHTILKHAKAGDFRVQSDHGGTVTRVETHLDLVEQAENILRVLPNKPCYARVDGIVRDGRFLLMEIELIEPEMFLEFSEDAAKQFALAVAAQVKSA